MNDDAKKLKALLSGSNGEADAEWVEELQKKYPFFSVAEFFASKGDMAASEREEIISRIALSMSDSEAVRRLAEGGEEDFYPVRPVAASPSTEQAIDKFLETYGSGDAAETETLERLIFNPVADYSQQLAREEKDDVPSVPTGDSQDDRINRFILSVREKEKSESPSCVGGLPGLSAEVVDESDVKVADKEPGSPSVCPVQAPAPAADTSLLSESLAKIYIKTGRYERAYEILSRLSLSFPEKNAYFADQLRFLRKLMLAESCRNKRDSENNHPE